MTQCYTLNNNMLEIYPTNRHDLNMFHFTLVSKSIVWAAASDMASALDGEKRPAARLAKCGFWEARGQYKASEALVSWFAHMFTNSELAWCLRPWIVRIGGIGYAMKRLLHTTPCNELVMQKSHTFYIAVAAWITSVKFGMRGCSSDRKRAAALLTMSLNRGS